MDIWNILKAVLFGIVEGITEWLPISSTGHMILLDEFIKLNVSEAFLDMFLVVIQLGAILAVVVLYWDKLWPFRFGGGPIIKKKTLCGSRSWWPASRQPSWVCCSTTC